MFPIIVRFDKIFEKFILWTNRWNFRVYDHYSIKNSTFEQSSIMSLAKQ